VINEILTNADTQDRGWLTPFGMGFLGWPEDPQLGRTWPGEGLLIAAVVLCAAATWILHAAHRATPQPERID
jgi:hypothetical protein